MSKLIALTPYALVLFTLAYGIIDVIKDWENYKRSALKIGALSILVLIAVLTFVSLRQTAHDDQDRRGQMQQLTGQVEAADTAQKENTAQFLKSFKDLSGRVANLQTQVKTDELQKKLASVQADLKRTEKELAPGPKAKLQFTFDPPKLAADGKTEIPVTETTLPVDAKGNMHIAFDIMNRTDVTAVDGEIILAICDSCKFTKEPKGSRKVTNELETQRDFPFERILPKTHVGEVADIIVPKTYSDVQIGISYRCRTCAVQPEFFKAIIHQQRTFLKTFP